MERPMLFPAKLLLKRIGRQPLRAGVPTARPESKSPLPSGHDSPAASFVVHAKKNGATRKGGAGRAIQVRTDNSLTWSEPSGSS